MGTARLNREGEYLLNPDFTAEDTYQYTMLNPYCWRGYCYAIEELTSHPDKYQYSAEDVVEVLKQIGMSDHMTDLQPSYQYLKDNDLLPAGKKEILSIPVGKDEGMVGYLVGRHEGPESVLAGPDAFVVEDDRITVLDSVNRRLMTFENGQYTGGFAVDACESAGWLYHQGNQWIVVSNRGYQVGCIYSEDGTHVKNVPYTMVESYMADRGGTDQKIPLWMEGEENRMTDVPGVGKTYVSVDGQSKMRWVYYYTQIDFLPGDKVLRKRIVPNQLPILFSCAAVLWGHIC